MTKTFHVDFKATGAGDGSAAKPWRSIPVAQKALRKLRSEGKLDGVDVRVLVRPGVCRVEKPIIFTPADGAPAGSGNTVTWTAEGGRAVISGSRRITNFKPGEINGVPCWRAELPAVRDGWKFTQLFVNNRRRLRAGLPAGGGFYRFTGVPEAEAKKDQGVFFHGAMSACFKPGDVFKFKNLEDVEFVVPDHWYENHLRVKSIDVKKNVVKFITRGFSRFSRDETGLTARYRVNNVREACREAGDWYLDRKEAALYYIPRPGETMGNAIVEAPVADCLLKLDGDMLDDRKHIHGLRFEHFEFRHGEWELPPESPGVRQADIQAPGAIRFTGAEDCALYGCEVHGVAGYGVDIMRGCHGCRVIACSIHDLGAGGVKVGPEQGLAPVWQKELIAAGVDPEHNEYGPVFSGRKDGRKSATTVADCTIHDGGILFYSAIGVWVGDAGGNRIVHNDIFGFNYSGISCGWTWGFAPAQTRDNRIEWNRIHDIGRYLISDMGAVYTLGRQPGTTVSHNFIYGVHSYGYGGWGLYTDEGSSWVRLEGNVVLDTKCSSFHQHYGRENTLCRNLLVEANLEESCRLSRAMTPRPIVFERNVCMFPGEGDVTSLWQSGHGYERAVLDRNAYVARPGNEPVFRHNGKLFSFEEWRKFGFDRHGMTCEGSVSDALGGNPAIRIPKAAQKLTGVTDKMVAKVVSETGPRYRGALPESIDAVQPEPERKRPLVEALLWPWEVEWPEDLERNKGLDKGTVNFARVPEYGQPELGGGASSPVSLTVENRGDAPLKGRYRFRVVPAGAAAKLEGEKTLDVTLGPGERLAWRGRLTSKGAQGHFGVEAVSDNPDMPTVATFFFGPEKK